MGFTKWLFKNGFGSIGSTAKTWSRIFLENVSLEQNLASQRATFFKVINIYINSNRHVRGSFNTSDPLLLLYRSDDCLAMLIWILICEIQENTTAIRIDEKTFNLATDVVYESVMANAAKYILKTPQEFKFSCIAHLDYKDNFHRVIVANNNMLETSYRVYINYGSYNTYFTDDKSFTESLEHYNNLVERNNFAWLSEMNSNKYVHLHCCTDQEKKFQFNQNIKQFNGKVRIKGIDFED